MEQGTERRNEGGRGRTEEGRMKGKRKIRKWEGSLKEGKEIGQGDRDIDRKGGRE